MHLNLCEKYILRFINKKGKLKAFHNSNLLSAMFMDLLTNKFVVIEIKNLSIANELTEEYKYLTPIYDLINNNNGISFYKIKRTLFYTKRNIYKEVINSLTQGMLEKGLLSFENEMYIPNEEVKEKIVEDIKPLITKKDLSNEQMYTFMLLRFNFDFTSTLDNDTRRMFLSQASYYYSLYNNLMYNPYSVFSKMISAVTIVSLIFFVLGFVETGTLVYYSIFSLISVCAIITITTTILSMKNILTQKKN